MKKVLLVNPADHLTLDSLERYLLMGYIIESTYNTFIGMGTLHEGQKGQTGVVIFVLSKKDK